MHGDGLADFQFGDETADEYPPLDALQYYACKRQRGDEGNKRHADGGQNLFERGGVRAGINPNERSHDKRKPQKPQSIFFEYGLNISTLFFGQLKIAFDY
jgi:hypothetical protein